MIQPRPYQTEAVAAIVEAASRGVQRALVALPTGCGKTVVFALLLQQRGRRSLVLAHRDELIQQAVDKLRLVDSTMPISVVKAERRAWVLSLGQHGTLRLIPDGADTWQVVRLAGTGQPTILGQRMPLVYAQGQAEDLARRLGADRLLDPHASWRQQAASDKQLALLRKCRIAFSPGITKGEAGELITAVLGDWHR